MTTGRDLHSFARPEQVRVTHCSLALEASFPRRTLTGSVTLDVKRVSPDAPLILDTRDLEIHSVTCGSCDAPFDLGDTDPILGTPLIIRLPHGLDSVHIAYATRPGATGLQWLAPKQTAGGRHPFLFSQNQSIHARSWIPIQDSPGVRFTYDARVLAPEPLTALMSAERCGSENNEYSFRMNLPVPAYLIALGIGDLAFAPLGARTGVWAEPPVVASAAREFSDAEHLVETVEQLYGPYLWGRYDLLILPPSFPFGGMENPKLTFATPTIIAGDKSLVSLVSHELAHSWSGNLVTNATWSDFWLNEGFTTYIENRIQEVIYGREQALMEQVIDRRELSKEMAGLSPRDQILHIDLAHRDPDEGTTRVPYIKGALLLRLMEQVFSRPVFDQFLKRYFAHFAFQSITTADALQYFQRELFDSFPSQAAQISIREWVYEPGLPASAPVAHSERLDTVARLARRWQAGEISAGEIPHTGWRTQEWLEFLQVVDRPLGADQMAALDDAFRLTQNGNFEVLDEWLLMSIESAYQPAASRLEQFLLSLGRMRYIKPLYIELMKTPAGASRARQVYAQARPGYHPIAQIALDKIVQP
ncbi:MAG: M1 family metallopeptidase [Acidobacteriaceae bacterium]|nr:M1 family metallopeptidase [Acidobacteriaceae bacterium]